MQNGTIGNRLLVHLSCYSRYKDEFVCPPEMTQDGMARKLGISRAHAALELKRLRQRNQVESRLAHVVRAKTRRKVYTLTMSGEERARRLKEDAKRKPVRIIDGNGGKECNGQDALRLLCSQGLSESEAYSLMLTSDTVSLRGKRDGCDAMGGPTSSGLVGRDQEVSRLSRWFNSPGKAVCVLSGGEGMGKTTLALSLFSNINGPLIWTTVTPMQSMRFVLSSIAGKLKALGRVRLASLLDSDTFDVHEVAIALAEDTAEGLLVFDDMHNSPDFEDFAGMFITMNNWPLKVLIVGRRKPGFCQRWSDTFQKPYEDIPIGGLDLESTRRLLESEGCDWGEKEISMLHETVRGRPQDLLVLLASGWTAGPQIPSIKDALLTAMDGEQMSFLGLASILQNPIDHKRANLSEEETTLLKRRWLFTRQADGFVLNGLVRETVLDALEPQELTKLHERAAVLQGRVGNYLEAINHYFCAGLQEKAVETIVARKDSISWRDAGQVLLGHLRKVTGIPALEAVRGEVLQGLGRLPEARLCYEKATGFESGPALADILLRLSDLEAQSLLLQDSERRALAALEIARMAGDKIRFARGMSSIARIQNLNGLQVEASDQLRKAIKLFEDAGEWVEMAVCRSTLGRIELERGNASEAVAQLTLALNSRGRESDTAAILCDLASAHMDMGDPGTAGEFFEKAIRVAESFGRYRTAIRAMSGASTCCLSSGLLDEALEHCNKALRLCEAIGDQALLSEIHANLGTLFRSMKRWKDAESHILTSIEMLKQLKLPRALAQRYNDLAELYETVGNTRKARLWTKRATKMMEWEERPSSVQGSPLDIRALRLPDMNTVEKPPN